MTGNPADQSHNSRQDNQDKETLSTDQTPSKETNTKIDVPSIQEMHEEVEPVSTNTIYERGPEETDEEFLSYMNAMLTRFRILAVIFACVGITCILLAVGLVQTHVITDLKIYNLIMSVGYAFIVFMAVVIFTRTRPYKRRIKIFKNEPLHTIIDPDAEDGVRIEDHSMRDTDEMFGILERKVRTEVIPQTEEYKALRKTWLTIWAAAAACIIVSVAIYLLIPGSEIIATLILAAFFVLVIVGFYIDRTKMKPLRDQWVAQFNMNEWEYRDSMKKYKQKQSKNAAETASAQGAAKN